MKLIQKIAMAVPLIASCASMSLAQAPAPAALSHAQAVERAKQIHADQHASKDRREAKEAEYRRERAVRIEAAKKYHVEQGVSKARKEAEKADYRRERAARIEAARRYHAEQRVRSN